MSPISTRRLYADACPIASALDVIGERWTLLIVRELLPGPLRFSDIRSEVAGINATILSLRLEQMAQAGLIGAPEMGLYGLTPRGQGLWPLVVQIAAWGLDIDSHRENAAQKLSPAAAVTALVARRTLPATGFSFPSQRIVFDPSAPQVLRRGSDVPLPQSGLEVTTDPLSLHALALGKLTPNQAAQEGRLALSGDPARIKAFLSH